jgi:hypothetical protein
MKPQILVAFILAMMIGQVKAAEVYLELGIGWIKDLPVEGSVEIDRQVVIEEQVIVSIEEPYSTFAAGVMSNSGWFAEINRFGVLDDARQSITRIEFGKRWSWNF